MSLHNIMRARKDAENRASLSEAERAHLPEHPAGLFELPDEVLDAVAGCGAITPPGIIVLATGTLVYL